MAKDAGEIRVGANGTLRVAEIDSPIPADIDEAFDDAWVDLGYADEDGLTVTDSKSLEVIRGWQAFYPLRRIITERDFIAAFKLLQWNGLNVPLAFGGGAVSETDNGFRYDPPEPQDLDERMLACDWQDGAFNYRIVMPKGMVTENVETNVVRTDAAKLPITFGITVDEGGNPWHLLTDDPSFADFVTSSS